MLSVRRDVPLLLFTLFDLIDLFSFINAFSLQVLNETQELSGSLFPGLRKGLYSFMVSQRSDYAILLYTTKYCVF